jgi:hypothetical protein
LVGKIQSSAVAMPYLPPCKDPDPFARIATSSFHVVLFNAMLDKGRVSYVLQSVIASIS